MTTIKLVSKGFFLFLCLDFMLEVILKLHSNRLISTILREFISTTFLTFRENQQAKEEFVSVFNLPSMLKIHENIIYLPAVSTMVLKTKERNRLAKGKSVDG